MGKRLLDDVREYIEHTAGWKVIVMFVLIFILSAAVTLSGVWIYTRR